MSELQQQSGRGELIVEDYKRRAHTVGMAGLFQRANPLKNNENRGGKKRIRTRKIQKVGEKKD